MGVKKSKHGTGADRRFCLQSFPVSQSNGSDSFSYSPIEVESYLPSGWSLEETDGTYEPKKRCWRIAVQDVSELVSPLEVDEKTVAKLGRIPALRAAIDRLVRRSG